jgi:HK97 family phage prohead protease
VIKETRFVELRGLSVNQEAKRIVGVAAAYNTLSADLGGFKEQIAPGAFTRSLAENDVRALYDHDSGKILGRTSAGTLQLNLSDTGLEFALTLPDTTYATDLVTLMARGDIAACSFGFYTRKQSWDKPDKESGLKIRILEDVDLREISIVGDPAYPVGTSAALRSLSEWRTKVSLVRNRGLFSFFQRRMPRI